MKIKLKDYIVPALCAVGAVWFVCWFVEFVRGASWLF